MSRIPDGDPQPRSKSVQESDGKNFERALQRLCAAFDVPMTDARREAYWRSFRKLSLLEFTGLVDMALVESTYASMPTVGALWELHRRNSGPPPEPTTTGKSGPNIQEQLCAYATLKLHHRLTPLEFSMPWTYVYREWIDEARQTPFNKDGRCAECTGVVIDLKDGSRIGFSVASMLADAEGHAKALRSFKPGPYPSPEQVAAWQTTLPDLRP